MNRRQLPAAARAHTVDLSSMHEKSVHICLLYTAESSLHDELTLEICLCACRAACVLQHEAFFAFLCRAASSLQHQQTPEFCFCVCHEHHARSSISTHWRFVVLCVQRGIQQHEHTPKICLSVCRASFWLHHEHSLEVSVLSIHSFLCALPAQTDCVYLAAQAAGPNSYPSCCLQLRPIPQEKALVGYDIIVASAPAHPALRVPQACTVMDYKEEREGEDGGARQHLLKFEGEEADIWTCLDNAKMQVRIFWLACAL